MVTALAVYLAETAANCSLHAACTLQLERSRGLWGMELRRHRQAPHCLYCNSWGSSRRDTGESLRLSLFILV
jgi:hypothetical protein